MPSDVRYEGATNPLPPFPSTKKMQILPLQLSDMQSTDIRFLNTPSPLQNRKNRFVNRMQSPLDFKDIMNNFLPQSSKSKLVHVDTVIRGGSLVVGSISGMSITATFLSGAVIIQPIFATFLLIASIGFYIMTLIRDDQ